VELSIIGSGSTPTLDAYAERLKENPYSDYYLRRLENAYEYLD
jgi:hypothetical protein